jgi:hypothetical protein
MPRIEARWTEIRQHIREGSRVFRAHVARLMDG